jgi:hypothetical protein
MLQLMLLLQCRQTLEDCHVSSSSRSWWYAFAAGHESTSGNPSLSYGPYYVSYYHSYPCLDFSHLYRLYRDNHHYHHCHPSLQVQNIWSEPIVALGYSFLLDELGDDLIGPGGHQGVFVHHGLQADFSLVIPWDSTKEVDNVSCSLSWAIVFAFASFSESAASVPEVDGPVQRL